jgi:hypothetical protein
LIPVTNNNNNNNNIITTSSCESKSDSTIQPPVPVPAQTQIQQKATEQASYRSNNKTILIQNVHKKYEGINAIKYNDANLFFQSLKEKIKNKEYFLFGCDICSKITSFYSDLINEFPEQKEDFIFITSKTNIYIENANSQFKDKYVFYSPSITTPTVLFSCTIFVIMGGRQNYPNAYLPNPFPKG